MNQSGVSLRYAVELGRELYRRRRALRMTQVHFAARLPGSPSLAAVRGWEQGTRDLPVSWLVQVCVLVGAEPHEVVAAVDHRVRVAPRVDLWALARSDDPVLRIARRWAVACLKASTRPAHVVPMPVSALPWLAALSGASVSELAAALPYVTHE